MNRESRNRLRCVVAQARALLEEDVKTQLNRFGIEEGGNAVPIGRLGHLGPDDAELRAKLLASINKEQGKRIELSEAYDRYVRHVGFTYLNRVAALRAMEVRGLLEKETIIRRDKYAGLSQRAYEISERQRVSNTAESTRLCFLEAFREVSQEIKVLFDVNDEYSVLFPSPSILEKVIELVSVDVPEDDWREEDVIGWIYQYYNSEARAELRKKRRKLRADDVPVLNQFYTSHWLVRALVDNTLGRLWLEMKGRMPKPGSGVAPSPEHLRNPNGDKVDEYCSYLIPSRQEPPARKRKPVRDVKVLDPACGSGHFLVYAFNVLYRMYLEDEPQTPKEQIPRLILENNLFGIDIDLRSVQLAALSLYLKAKEYNRNAKITKMNLVCADVRIINGDLKKIFLRRLEPDVDLQKIFIRLFDELEYTFDIGGLLKVRTPFEKLIEARGPQAHFQVRPSGQTAFSKSGLSAQTSISFDGQADSATIQPSVTLNEMLNALISFEKDGLEKKDMGSMLFAAEAEKSVGLLTLLSQKYDVVVMNPPYGDLPASSKDYIKAHYPRTHYDYYAAFIEQAVDICKENGFVGMLTGRTFMFLRWFEKVRTEILLREARSEIVFDLNSTPADNILDEATARWAATVARKFREKNEETECVFVRLTIFEGEDKKICALEKAVSSDLMNNEDLLYHIKLGELRKLPRMPYSYWLPRGIADIFKKYPPLDKKNAGRPAAAKVAELKTGLQTGDDERFVRFWWEVNKEKITNERIETYKSKKWVPYLKGGESYYDDICLVVNWENDGTEIKNFPKSVVRNEQYYFMPCVCWSDIASSVLLDFRLVPNGCIFSIKAHALFGASEIDSYSLMGLLNSSFLSSCLLVLDPTMHSRPPGYVSQLPISYDALNNQKIGEMSALIYNMKKRWKLGDEVSPNFEKPWILLSKDEVSENLTIQELAQLSIEKEVSLKKKIIRCQKTIDKEVYLTYSITDAEKTVMEDELCFIKKIDQEKSLCEESLSIVTAKEHAARLLSFYVKEIVERNPEGIILFQDLAQQLKEEISRNFGENNAKMESDLAIILGKSIEKWLDEDFFSFHLTLYKRRPIFWLLSSANYSTGKGSGAFNCLLHYQKLSKDTLPKIRTRPEYLKGLVEGARWKAEGLRKEIQKINLDNKRESHLQAEYLKAQAELAELQAFDQKLAEVSNPRAEPTRLGKNASWVEQKIAEVRDDGWNPVIDYGVRVNIEPLKEARLLHPAADRVK